MNKSELINKITKISMPANETEIQLILRLITVLATIHLINKTEKIRNNSEKSDNADDIINMIK